MLGQLVSPSTFQEAPPVPSQRRPPRDDVVTYRIRVDLDDAEPPIWRRAELASDLTVDRVHHVLQTAMGWTDSHLHEFTSGSATDGVAEHYRPQDSIDEGLPGIDETEVRLDEVVEPEDRLYYNYDFGDDWSHTLHLEAVVPREPDAPLAVCVAGARACPPEDCGGIWGYHELLTALSQPPNADNSELREWVGPDFDPDRFDVDDVNTALTNTLGLNALVTGVLSSLDPAGPLGDLLSRLDPIPAVLAEALAASLQPIVEPDDDTKTAMLHPYARFLDQVGDAGIALTQAGYLPPVHVEAVADLLGLDDLWIGKNNRENQTYPVLEFRECAQRLGLVRKAHNRLSLTKAAARARPDVEALWQLLASALPLGLTTRGPEARASHDAGLLLLVGVAAGLSSAERNALVGAGLAMLGWRAGPFAELTSRDVRELRKPTEAVLEHIGAVPRWRFRDGETDSDAPPPGAAAFARAALRL